MIVASRYVRPSNLLLSKNATATRDWKSVSGTTPVISRTRNGNRRYGTKWRLPCTDAVETRRSSPVCSPGKVLMWYSVKMMKDVSMAQLSSTIRTVRYITVPDLEKSFRQTLLSGCLTVRPICLTWICQCLLLIGKAFSPPKWKAPSNRLSESSALTPTVPTRRKRRLPAGCNARRKRNAVPAEYPDYRFYKPLKLYSLCNKKMI